ncbi:multidrug ABC transporter ATP-binding protein [Chryseomicrobium excrementi]|uniref:Multidrug ABC transporter ATP-binding protein n=1 Tax=Chryseomicrobium excrementi TaxID=2041346 RepID=A0A2M9EXT4_9BACL|nr:ABC transporter ATP-binding protein [Chryseomicrobium excrementi]PJK16016.1 multidrug ABC transporter ATP-binding protein [Chryseomicrobium excrementi]
MLTLQNIGKDYGKFTALKELNLQFENGVYGLLAPNGAGKTTLIQMLVTLVKPTSGEILYDGKPILSMGEAYREKIGYLPQHFGYYKHYSPRKYLRYIAALKGIEKSVVEKRIDEVLDLVALQEVKDKKMRKFSGGMIQRIGIAQAILAHPKVLILDEPTAGLDPKERARFRHLLSDLARDRIVLISTHIVSDIESIANEIVMIRNQTLLYKGSIPTICKSLDGMIYEVTMPFEDFSVFRKNYLTLEEKQEQGNMMVRFYSEEEPKAEWTAVTPELEDVFLVSYANESTKG